MIKTIFRLLTTGFFFFCLRQNILSIALSSRVQGKSVFEQKYDFLKYKKLNVSDLGDRLGVGMHKIVYKIKGHPNYVFGRLKSYPFNEYLLNIEYLNLMILEVLGFNILKCYGIVDLEEDGKVIEKGIIYEYIPDATSTQDFFDHPSNAVLCLKNLQNFYDYLVLSRRKDITVFDLQFLFNKKEEWVLADPRYITIKGIGWNLSPHDLQLLNKKSKELCLSKPLHFYCLQYDEDTFNRLRAREESTVFMHIMALLRNFPLMSDQKDLFKRILLMITDPILHQIISDMFIVILTGPEHWQCQSLIYEVYRINHLRGKNVDLDKAIERKNPMWFQWLDNLEYFQSNHCVGSLEAQELLKYLQNQDPEDLCKIDLLEKNYCLDILSLILDIMFYQNYLMDIYKNKYVDKVWFIKIFQFIFKTDKIHCLERSETLLCKTVKTIFEDFRFGLKKRALKVLSNGKKILQKLCDQNVNFTKKFIHQDLDIPLVNEKIQLLRRSA